MTNEGIGGCGQKLRMIECIGLVGLIALSFISVTEGAVLGIRSSAGFQVRSCAGRFSSF